MSRKKKNLRAVISQLLERPVGEKAAAEIEGIVEGLGGEITGEAAIAVMLIYKAIRGDTAAARYITDLVSEKQPPEKAEILFKVVK